MEEDTIRKYHAALLNMAKSRTAVIYCIRNLNRAPEVSNKPVYEEMIRLAQLSGDTLNEVMSKVLMALLGRAEEAEQKAG